MRCCYKGLGRLDAQRCEESDSSTSAPIEVEVKADPTLSGPFALHVTCDFFVGSAYLDPGRSLSSPPREVKCRASGP